MRPLKQPTPPMTFLEKIEDDNVCSATNKKRKIKLDKGPHSGLILRQYQLSNHNVDWERNLRCRFQVNPESSREGVLAVIQHLSFRKNATTDECIDYVQFTRKDGSSSQKFCGRFNAALHMDHNFVDPSQRVSSGTAIVDERGELDTFIFIAKEHLQSDEEMDLSIVYTAYKRMLFIQLKKKTIGFWLQIVHKFLKKTLIIELVVLKGKNFVFTRGFSMILI